MADVANSIPHGLEVRKGGEYGDEEGYESIGGGMLIIPLIILGWQDCEARVWNVRIVDIRITRTVETFP